jgi:hypothetical protein
LGALRRVCATDRGCDEDRQGDQGERKQAPSRRVCLP